MSVAPKPERHDRLSSLFLQACELPTDDREPFLRQHCADDPPLLRELLELLPYDDQLVIVDEPIVRLGGLEGGEMKTARPERIGQYVVEGVLGEGGMGTVYRARQQNPERVVALKVIRWGLASPATQRRFEQEADLLGRLHHPGIAQIYEAGTAGQGLQPYFAMELIRGRSLLAHADEHGLTQASRLELLAKICEAVQHAHQQGIVHRDLKPANVIVEDETEQPKIVDFGVARVIDAELNAATLGTREGQLIGTLPYMSPEQLRGDGGQVDYRADVYALGVIAFELLTGALPYDLHGKSVFEAARIVQTTPVPRLSVRDRACRGDVEIMVRTAMEHDPTRRYQSAAEFGQDIRRYLGDQPIAARPPSTLYQLQKFARRNRAVVVATAVAMGLLIAAVIGTSYGLIVARGQRDMAQRAADKAEAVSQFLLGVLATPAPGIEGREVKVVDALLAAEDEIAKAFPDQPEIRADVHAEMATTLARLGQFEQAERYARTALQMRRETLGETHLDTIKTMNILGNILTQSTGGVMSARNEEARDLLDHALAMCRQQGAEGNGTLLSLLSNRGSLAFAMGALAEAEQFAREMLALAIQHEGELGANTLLARQSLAVLANRRGNSEDAAEELATIAQAQSQLHGERNPQTLKTRRIQALTLSRSDRMEEAEQIYQTQIPVAKEVLGWNHIEVVRWLNDYGYLLKKSDRFSESAATYREALRHSESIAASDPFLQILIKDGLSHALLAMDDLEEAERLLRECITTLSPLEGSGAAPTLREAYKLVHVLILSGQYEEAVKWSGEQLAIAEESHPSTSAVVAISRIGAARALLAADQLEAARKIIEVCLRDCPPRSPREHYLLTRAWKQLSVACRQTGLTDYATVIEAR